MDEVERVAKAIWRVEHPHEIETWEASAACYPGSTEFKQARAAIAAMRPAAGAETPTEDSIADLAMKGAEGTFWRTAYDRTIKERDDAYRVAEHQRAQLTDTFLSAEQRAVIEASEAWVQDDGRTLVAIRLGEAVQRLQAARRKG